MLRPVLLVGVVVIATPSPADACLPRGERRHDLDPTHASDTTPPAAGRVSSAWAWAIKASGSCGAHGDLFVNVRASDETTPEDKLGFQIRILDSTGYDFHDVLIPLRADDGTLSLGFDPTVECFSVDLEVAAVDLNGNVGPFSAPFHFEWVNPVPPEEASSGGGCATSSGAGWLAGLALLALRRRRRR